MTLNTNLCVAVINWAWRGIKAYCSAWFYSLCCGGSGKLSEERSPASLNHDAGNHDAGGQSKR
jgi:hypothetical protein